MNNNQIKYMVDRFLGWKLPDNFNPDGGISFKRMRNEQSPWPAKNEPVGTNLLDAMQAEEMVRYMVDGLPAMSEYQIPTEIVEAMLLAYENTPQNLDGTHAMAAAYRVAIAERDKQWEKAIRADLTLLSSKENATDGNGCTPVSPSTDSGVAVEDGMENQFIEEVGWPQVHGETSSVKFTVQSGPIKEFGVNGCQIDDVIAWAKAKIEGFNQAFPCRENSMIITKLDEALLWSAKRKMDREKRNVEGTRAG